MPSLHTCRWWNCERVNSVASVFIDHFVDVTELVFGANVIFHPLTFQTVIEMILFPSDCLRATTLWNSYERTSIVSIPPSSMSSGCAGCILRDPATALPRPSFSSFPRTCAGRHRMAPPIRTAGNRCASCASRAECRSLGRAVMC